MPKSTVSRKIAELEEGIGAQLVRRTTRKLSLTDVGHKYYEHSMRILAEVEEAERAMAGLQVTPRGLLRVTTPPTSPFLSPIFAEFLGRYPDVQIEVHSTDRIIDLIGDRFDVAIRYGEVPDSSLVSRRLGAVRLFVVGAPSFLKRTGRIAAPVDVERCNCIVFGGGSRRKIWRLQHGARLVDINVRPRLVANHYDTLRDVALAGFGLALLPDYMCAADLESRRLRRVLEEWATPEIPISALYPTARHPSAKLVALLNLLQERLAPMASRKRAPG